MRTQWNPETLLQNIGRELEKITVIGIQQESDCVLRCAVETRFIEEEFGDEEEQYTLYLIWDAELNIISIEIGIITPIPIEYFGWMLDQLNTMLFDERWCIQGHLELPQPEEEDQTISLIGTWRVVALEGTDLSMLAPILRTMLQGVCVDTMMMANSLASEQRNVQRT